jgi:diguanylate cyclase (GGDEF)-like protein/PAS domain S-box-containing protein
LPESRSGVIKTSIPETELMSNKPTYEELEQEVIRLRSEVDRHLRDTETHRESEQRYKTILERIQDAYYEVDFRGDFTFFNHQMCEMLGYSEKEMMGMNNRQYLDEYNAKLVYQTFNRVFRTEKPSTGFDWKLTRKDQSEIWVNASVSLVKNKNDDKVGFRGIVRDITRQKALEEELHRKAYFDGLTGLANRSLLNDRFDKAIARAYRYGSLLAVYMVDMNQTKDINDTLGHAAGDELIQGVAQRLEQSVRESDTVARTGGDEFVILGEALSLEKGAWSLGEKIINHIKDTPFNIQGNIIFQDVSVGFSLYPLDGQTKEDLLRQADIAMYYAKESLSIRPHRYSTDDDMLSTRFSIAQELRKAIEKNQFLIYYQPQVDLKTREVIGMEALLRWNHPEKGLISPSDFIPVLERTGLIRTVGLRVEKSVCQQIAAWKKECRPINQKTINCCIYELNNPVMLNELLGTIKEFGVDSSMIGIEITERVATRQIEEVRKLLQALSDAGITILLDDFGTGYSSLSLLQKLPIDIVKIDQTFIHAMLEDKYSASLVKAIINMCHETDKKVMAEGIETEEQLRFLLNLGCDYGQGFLLGRPTPPEQVYV